MDTPQRRELDFTTFDQIRADIENLQALPYRQLGKWSLAQICDHLAATIETNIQNRPMKVPLILKILAPIFAPLIRRNVLKTRKMRAGLPAPMEFAPQDTAVTSTAVARLMTALKDAENYPAERVFSPVLRWLTNAQWKELQKIHCSHHLSFLIPGPRDKSN